MERHALVLKVRCGFGLRRISVILIARAVPWVQYHLMGFTTVFVKLEGFGTALKGVKTVLKIL